jgi:hypothetical protein
MKLQPQFYRTGRYIEHFIIALNHILPTLIYQYYACKKLESLCKNINRLECIPIIQNIAVQNPYNNDCRKQDY